MEDDRQEISSTSAVTPQGNLDRPSGRGVRHTLAAPLAGMGICALAAVPVAGHNFGWTATSMGALALGFLACMTWLAVRAGECRREASDRAAELRQRASDQDRIRGEAALRHLIADLSIQQAVLIQEARTSTRLSWRVLHTLRQQRRNRRSKGGGSLAARVGQLEEKLLAAERGAFDPATWEAIKSLNNELAAH